MTARGLKSNMDRRLALLCSSHAPFTGSPRHLFTPHTLASRWIHPAAPQGQMAASRSLYDILGIPQSADADAGAWWVGVR